MEIDVLTSSFLGLRDKLHHIALSYLENDEDAKDALQDTWLKLRNGSKVETTSEARNKLIGRIFILAMRPVPLCVVSSA